MSCNGWGSTNVWEARELTEGVETTGDQAIRTVRTGDSGERTTGIVVDGIKAE